MTKKRDDYARWLEERKEKHRAKREKRKAKKKAKKEAARTWKAGCLITFKTLDSCRKWRIFICRMKKVPKNLNVHSCTVCSMVNNSAPCLNGHTDTHKKCYKKRQLNLYPHIIGRIDKHGKYHLRTISI